MQDVPPHHHYLPQNQQEWPDILPCTFGCCACKDKVKGGGICVLVQGRPVTSHVCVCVVCIQVTQCFSYEVFFNTSLRLHLL